MPLALGLDFGTESVRALLLDLTGREQASAIAHYPHGQITNKLPTTTEDLPPDFALQHPQDWIDSSAQAVRAALEQSGAGPSAVLSIGIDFTSCTMLPTLADSTPLCMTDRFRNEKYAWPKLWKHHGAKTQTERFNTIAHRRKEKWLPRYGGTIGLEWFFPKVLETLENAPDAYEAAEVWLEAGDWFVWKLIGGPAAALPRSTCQAGYKALWSAETGYPSRDFFKAVHPRLAHVVTEKMPGRLVAPGRLAGHLTAEMAQRFNLPESLPVSAAIIDAHAGVPGAGVSAPGTLVMVMGTSGCHMLNARTGRAIPGVAGIVKDGILPGYFGYETGQAAVGDAFDWLRKTVNQSFDTLNEGAARLPPGAEGVRAIDWLNGCRTPLMDGRLTASFTGLTLNHGPHHLYRALLEASAFGLRWIVELLEKGGAPVRKLVATGGLPHHNPLLIQICADVLHKPITIHPSKQGPALGAAILGLLAAGPQASGFKTAAQAVEGLAGAKSAKVVTPNRGAAKVYEPRYLEYRRLAARMAADPKQ